MFREKPHLDSPLELPKIQMIFLRIMIHLSRLKGNWETLPKQMKPKFHQDELDT